MCRKVAGTELTAGVTFMGGTQRQMRGLKILENSSCEKLIVIYYLILICEERNSCYREFFCLEKL